MVSKELQETARLQATLTAIGKGLPVYFNVAQFKKYGLITTKRVRGRDGKYDDSKLKFILTPKAHKYLAVQLPSQR